MHHSLDEIKNRDYSQLPPMAISTSYHRDGYSGFNNPNAKKTDPELFFISEFLCLYWKGGKQTENFEKLTGVPLEICDFSSTLKYNEKSSNILVVNEGVFKRITSKLVKHTADDFRLAHINAVAQYKGIHPGIAEILIEKEAQSIRGNSNSEELYYKSFVEASNRLQQKY